jgi:hypothetical protein
MSAIGRMKAMGLGIAYVVLFAAAVQAGEIAKGKTCDYDPGAFGRPAGLTSGHPDPGYTQGSLAGQGCNQAAAGSDWRMGGSKYNHAGKVEILEISSPPYIRAGCELGRENQVEVMLPGETGMVSRIFPRFLSCP